MVKDRNQQEEIDLQIRPLYRDVKYSCKRMPVLYGYTVVPLYPWGIGSRAP
jgi:hypothetical protein